MYWINGLYTYTPPGGNPQFQAANPGAGVPNGTELNFAWFNDVQGELLNIVTSEGLTPEPFEPTQVLAALDLRYKSGRLINIQRFTNSGTYNPTTGTNSIIVDCQGGGGAGGGAAATTSSTQAAAPGGSGGTFGRGRFTSGFTGGIAVTVGVGGAPVSGAAGGPGGASSFGALLGCAGGLGGSPPSGSSAPAGFGPGTPSPAMPGGANIVGFPGGPGGGPVTVGLTLTPSGGAGGDSYFGRGGNSNATAVAPAGVGYGGGGAGAANGTSATAQLGGGGAPGIVIVYEYS